LSLEEKAKQSLNAYRGMLKLADGDGTIAMKFYRNAYVKDTERWVIAQVEIEAKIEGYEDLIGKDPEHFNNITETETEE
jgi:hypothetical protein